MISLGLYHRRRGSAGSHWPLAALVAGVMALTMWAPAVAQEETPAGTASQTSQKSETADEAASTPIPQTFLDSVTVTATLSPSPLRDTPGVVSVISEDTIQRQMVQNFADLVKYEPGVYVENNITRLGLNGFNIRGIGGNRVMTQVDGVQTSEQFDFGPLNVHQVSLDVDTLKSVEIVRSANSSLYGSDALGGVVSLLTKDPVDYLGTASAHVGVKTTWDGRSDDVSGNLVIAGGGSRVQGSVFVSGATGNEFGNQGTITTTDDTRTAPNPQDRRSAQVLGKVVVNVSPGNRLRGSVELLDMRVETAAFSQQGDVFFGPIRINNSAVDAVDTQDRQRFSLDHTLVSRAGLDRLSWSVYGQNNETSQVVDESRTTFAFGPPVSSTRHGTLDYEQFGFGGSGQGQKWLGGSRHGALLTFGVSAKRDRFDILRDRMEANTVTGAPVPTRLIFPAKYFPKSDVTEVGTYVQAELELGRVTIVPGVRYDRFSLDADQSDPVFLASLSPEPADFSADAVSPKVGVAARLTDLFTVHAQYSGGFRAPPYSTVNTGFTNLASGYTTFPNTSLNSETSDNVEVGVRGTFKRASISVTAFSNQYDDFIELTALGFNPVTRLLEFQSQNLSEVEIEGVELRAEAFLTESVSIRGSYAAISGTDVSGDDEVPLGSIAPDEGVIGFSYHDPSGRFGSELSVRFVESQSQIDAGEGQFAPSSYQVVDLLGYVSLAQDLLLRLGVLNLTDTTYFEWWNVRGRNTGDPVIDRYSSPGISFIASLGYGW